MGILLCRTRILFGTMLDVSGKASLRLSHCLHQDQYCAYRRNSAYHKAVVNHEPQPEGLERAYLQRKSNTITSSKDSLPSFDEACLRIEHIWRRGPDKHGRPRPGLSAAPLATTTALLASKPKKLSDQRTNTASINTPATVNKSESAIHKRRRRPKYPPELESVYRKTRAQNALTKAIRKIEVKVPCFSQGYEASEHSPVKQANALSQVTPVAGTSKNPVQEKSDRAAKGPRSTKTIVASTKDSVHQIHNHTSRSIQALRSGKGLATAGPTTRNPINISPPSPYREAIEKLKECRKIVDVCKGESHSAKAAHIKAQATLQCLVRQGSCAPKFWVKQQKAAKKIMGRTMKGLGTARFEERQAVSAVSRDLIEVCVATTDDMTDRRTREDDGHQW